MSKRDNRKKLIFFIALMAVIAVLSGVLGFYISLNEENIGELMAKLSKNIVGSVGIIMLVFDIFTCVLDAVGIAVSFVLYRVLSKKTSKAYIDDNEFEEIEKRMDLCGSVMQTFFLASMVISMICVCCNILNIDFVNDVLYFLVLIMTFATAIISSLVMQRVMKLQNKLSPNVDLKVYDLKIMSTQEQQCDEAQRQLLYKATYNVFKLCVNAITVLFILFAVITIAFHISILTVIILGVIVIFMNTVFLHQCYRVQHPKN